MWWRTKAIEAKNRNIKGKNKVGYVFGVKNKRVIIPFKESFR